MTQPARMLLLALLAAVPASAGPAVSGLLARSGELRGGAPPQALAADVRQVKTLVLVATGYSWGQAAWGEPELVAADGTRTRLTELAPVSATVGWGAFSVNHGPDGAPLKVADRAFRHGLFAHADSEVVYSLDSRFARLETWVGVNQTAGTRGAVVFEIRDASTLEWRRTVEQMRRGFTRDCLAGLRRALASAPASAAPLRLRLEGYETDFAAVRRALDGDPEEARERLEGFRALVRDIRMLALDAPLLFVKRHAYFSPHIYDDHLTWHPGGGVYVLENPAAPADQQVVRAVIDPQTAQTLGEGVYRDPDLSWDGRKLLFAFKGSPDGDTSLYEIGSDGTGLRRLTDPGRDCASQPRPGLVYGTGHHDYSPCYLPGGRIAFVSTRTAGLVMCFNNHIATLHTMNADGSDLRPISVNNVTEFDPTVLPDGRIVYGRWEYVDKTALYMQSLWTMHPDGTQESALFANNLAKPTAVLDARPVPGSPLLVATLTPHNGQSVGAIAMLDPRRGKNRLEALANFTPEYPTEMDQGLGRGPCDPWPLDEDAVLVANNAENRGTHAVLELIDRFGFRFVIRREPDIGCFSPMLLKPRSVPPARPSAIRAGEPACFLLHDIYAGMPGVPRGTVKRLRILETTSRVSGIPPGGRWWNQAFLVSWQGSYDVKRFLGTVPVEDDGSAFFEAPPGKALYFQALDSDGRLVQSMRTFVQAAPGVTRACQGCHVPDDDAAPSLYPQAAVAARRPARVPAAETWGGGFLDYPGGVQPVLDRHCVSCHGGAGGIAGGLDLSGGWTWAFSISYETLLKNALAGFLNCNNGSVRTADLLPPRTHGSGAAPLGAVLASGHQGRLAGLPARDRDLLLAWMDGNANFHGTWDYTEQATCGALLALREPLLAEMDKAGCVRCHARELGNDWVNLQAPERSRLLRAPLAKTPGGFGLAWCRDRKALPVRVRLVDQRLQPPDVFRPARDPAPDPAGAAVTPFADTNSAPYSAMLAIIRRGRAQALQQPRVDMPGAVVQAGRCRELPPLAPPPPMGDREASAPTLGAVAPRSRLR